MNLMPRRHAFPYSSTCGRICIVKLSVLLGDMPLTYSCMFNQLNLLCARSHLPTKLLEKLWQGCHGVSSAGAARAERIPCQLAARYKWSNDSIRAGGSCNRF